MSPQRIQLRRTKGWRKPEGAIVVARPTRWGNPHRIVPGAPAMVVEPCGTEHIAAPGEERGLAVRLFRETLYDDFIGYPSLDEIRSELAGHDLACWCPLDQPCHADVLLELANRPVEAP